MEDPSRMAPGCPFKNSTGTGAGRCTGTPGVLSAAEINENITNGGQQTFYEEEAVQVVTWDNDQWVSWDDGRTLKLKQDFVLAGKSSTAILHSSLHPHVCRVVGSDFCSVG